MRQPVRICTLALAAMLAVPATLVADTAYAPPAVAAGENGWEDYVEALTLDRASASGLSPTLDSAEAAVVLFLASRIRGDNDWKSAMVSDPDRKAKQALKAWKDWTLHSARLEARKLKDTRGYIRVWMDFTVDGDRETGSDDFTMLRDGDTWRIASPPS